MKNKYLLLKADGSAEFISLPDDSGEWLDAVYGAIGCDCVEIVSTVVKDVVLIVDESGKLKDGWQKRINYAASQLYAGSAYGDPIVGDVVLAYRVGPDLFPVPDYLLVQLNAMFDLYDEVTV